VATAAADKDFADVKFILYHAGLDPPNPEIGPQTLQLVASQPNLYVDISWLDLDRLRQTLEIVPMERILFGTDLPLGGDKHYWDYFEKLKALNLSNDQWMMLMEANSREVFRL
jgi:predicted TIM-barrel fold metal-dependent hydrolase